MQTIEIAGFVGPTNTQATRKVDAERTVNWFTERVGPGSPRVPGSLRPTPGCQPHVALFAGPVRGLIRVDVSTGQRVFAVGGGVFHEVLGSQTAPIYGTVAIDGNPAEMATNGDAGNQVMIVSGGLGYIFDLTTNVLTQITDASFPDVVSQVLFFDGFFIVLTPSGDLFLSDLEDGSSWNALNFFAENQFADTVIAISKTHDNLWLYGTQNTGPYYNSGQPISPYIPIPGALIEHGIISPWSPVEIDNTTYWLSQDEHGRFGVASGQGYTPIKVSNPAIDYKLSQSQRLAQAMGFGYQLGANLFYCVLVDDLDTTIVFNIATKQFHEWGHWITDPPPGRYIPHVARNHVFAFGKHLVGSRVNNVVYEIAETFGVDRLVL